MQKIFLLNFAKTECENLSDELNLGAILSDLGLEKTELLEQKVSEFFSDEVYLALKECEFLNNEFNVEFNEKFTTNFSQNFNINDHATEREREREQAPRCECENSKIDSIESSKKLSPNALLLGVNYPIREQKDKEFVAQFIKTAIKNSLSFNLIESFQNYTINNNIGSIKSILPNLYYYPKPNQYTEVDDFALFSAAVGLSASNFKIEQLYRENKLPRDLRGKMHSLLRRDLNLPDKILKKRIFLESRKLFNIAYLWQSYEVSIEQKEYDLIERINDFYPLPKGINISTTNVCNLKCVMCQLHSPTLKYLQKTDYFKQKVFVDEKVVYKAIDFIAQNKNLSTTCGFTASGEATLDSRLCDFISYAKSKGIAMIYLVSNGTTLDKFAHKLLDAGLNRITISIDGSKDEVYEKIRGFSLQKVEQGVKELAQYARELVSKGANIEIELACVLNHYFLKHDSREAFLAKWEPWRDIITSIVFSNLQEYDENGIDIHRKILTKEQEQMPCDLAWSGFSIDCYGEISVCCTMSNTSLFDLVSIGNVNEKSCEEIWNGERASALRREILQNKFNEFKICEKCVEKFRFAPDEFGESTIDQRF